MKCETAKINSIRTVNTDSFYDKVLIDISIEKVRCHYFYLDDHQMFILKKIFIHEFLSPWSNPFETVNITFNVIRNNEYQCYLLHEFTQNDIYKNLYVKDVLLAIDTGFSIYSPYDLHIMGELSTERNKNAD